jgi:hypothetical protein
VLGNDTLKALSQQIGLSARQQDGLYTREAIEERRHLRSLMRQSRMLIKDIE